LASAAIADTPKEGCVDITLAPNRLVVSGGLEVLGSLPSDSRHRETYATASTKLAQIRARKL